MNGLDPKTQRWLVDFLNKLNKAGKTLITSTHNLEILHEISNRSILFDETHTIVADLPTEEILEDIELLKKLIWLMNIIIFMGVENIGIFMIIIKSVLKSRML